MSVDHGIVSAIMGHLLGDFILQNDWMASGKKRSHLICALHSVIVTLCICTLSGWWSVDAWCLLVMFHFVIDRWDFVGWSMRSRGSQKFTEPPMAPWSIIITDQVWHLWTIWVVGAIVVK